MTLPAPLDRLEGDPIFVIGCARSGTTWVLDAFGAHPDVATVNESWLFSPTVGLGPLLGKGHWDPDHPGGPQGLSRFVSREDFVAEVRTFAARVLGKALGDGQRFLVEKSPNHVWTADGIAEVFPEARFIHVVRDGRDVAVSLLAAGDSWAPQWKESSAASVQQAASTWRRALERAAVVAPALDDRLLEVRYEDLHADPVSGYRRLFDFAEVPYDEDLLERVRTANDFPSNYTPNERGFRRGGRVGDWTDRFSPADCLAFQLAAGELLIELGYEADDRWVERLADRST